MRLLNFGAETQSFPDRGWTLTGAGGHAFVGALGQRLSPNGNGGKYAATLGSFATATAAESPDFAMPAIESEHRVGAHHLGNGAWEYRLRNGGATIAHIEINGSGNVELYVNAVLKATSAGVLTSSTWYTLTARYLMLSSGGAFEVYLDADQTTPFVSWTGDTDPTAATDIEAVQLSAGFSDYFDDVAVQAPSLRYDGGTGSTPIVGEVLTGSVTSVTCVVTAVEAGSNGTSGRVLVRSVSGTLQDNEALTGDTAFVAVNNAPAATTANPSSIPGLDTNSGHITPHGYVLILNPDANGAFSECTANPVAAMGNYENVRDWLFGSSDTVNIVESATTGDRDFYGVESVPAGFSGVECTEVIAWAQKQGTVINNIELGIRPASTEYYSAVEALGSSYGPFGDIYDRNPEDGENWEPSDITATQAGFRLTT